MDLTLVIPAKYEAESLPIFLKEIEKIDVKKKIILDPKDNLTLNAIKNFSGVEIYFQKEKGYGSALKEGIENSSTEFFCIINADGSMDSKDIYRMYDLLKRKELDFVFASRYEKPHGGSDDDDVITKFGNFFFTLIGNIFFSLRLSDILFTYVLGRVEKFKFLNILSKDFTFCVEFPIKVSRNNMNYSTIPSYERCRIAGKKKVNPFYDGFLILIKMIKMFVNR